MKKVEWFWNMMYYQIWLFNIKSQKLFDYINPLYYINKIPKVKKFHEKHGIGNVSKFINDGFDDPHYGVNITRATSFMGGLLILIECVIMNIVQKITGIPLIEFWLKDIFTLLAGFLVLFPLTIMINHCLLFNNEKYIEYFKLFEVLSKEEKTKYARVCIIFITIVHILFIGSLWC